MTKVHLSQDLCDTLTAKGYDRVEGMSWNKVASNMMMLIDRVNRKGSDE